MGLRFWRREPKPLRFGLTQGGRKFRLRPSRVTWERTFEGTSIEMVLEYRPRALRPYRGDEHITIHHGKSLVATFPLTELAYDMIGEERFTLDGYAHG